MRQGDNTRVAQKKQLDDGIGNESWCRGVRPLDQPEIDAKVLGQDVIVAQRAAMEDNS